MLQTTPLSPMGLSAKGLLGSRVMVLEKVQCCACCLAHASLIFHRIYFTAVMPPVICREGGPSNRYKQDCAATGDVRHVSNVRWLEH